MKKTLTTLAVVAGLITAVQARAEVGVTGNLGSTGVGAHATVPLTSTLNARLGANYLGYTHRFSTTGLTGMDYELKLKTNTYDALLDWYPMRDSVFRLTGGLVYNGNQIDVQMKSNLPGRYTLLGRTYTAADAGRVEGRVNFRKVAPYLGIGWGNAAVKEKGWSFSVDLGVLFQGAPNTTLANRDCTAPALACNLFAADVERERRALNDEARKYSAYPVLRVVINYRF